MGEEKNVYRVLMGKPEGKRPLDRPRRRWEDGMRMDLRETGWGCRVDPVGSGCFRWQTLLNMVMNLRVLASQT
jgi:hypothetical protein